MESQHLDNKLLGHLLDGFGYLFFVIGLLCALVVAYFERGTLAKKLDQGVVELWPIAMALGGFVLFVIAKVSRIRHGVPVSFGATGMPTKYSFSYLVGFVLMAVGYGLTFSWMWE